MELNEIDKIIELTKAIEFELVLQLLIGNRKIYENCSEEDFKELYNLTFCKAYGDICKMIPISAMTDRRSIITRYKILIPNY